MAIYHLSMKSLGRKSGQSAVAAAAYRATEKLVDIDGEVKDFTKKEKALWDVMLAPKDAPEWTKDRGEYWRTVERKENRSNSEFCKNIDLALPKELLRDGKPTTAMIGCATKWAWDNFVARGLVVDVTIHGPHKNKDGTINNNWHAHVLVSTRAIGKDGWAKHKDALLTDKNRNTYLEELRKNWADVVNSALAHAGKKERIDHRTLEEQGIDRQPQQHMGPAATAIERRGGAPKRTRTGETKRKPRISLRHEYLAMDEQKIQADIAACELELSQLVAQKQAKAQSAQKPSVSPVPAKSQPAQPIQTVQRPKTQEQLEMERQAAIVNSWNANTWQTYVYGDAGTPGTRRNLQKNSYAKAQAMYVEKHATELGPIINSECKKAKERLTEHEKTRPSDIVKKGNIFIVYRDDNGNEFTKYEKYKASQEQIQSRWNADHVPLKVNYDHMNELAQAGNSKDWQELAQLIDKYMPQWAKKIRAGAQKLLETAAEFLPYRAREAAIKARQTREAGLQQTQNRPRDTNQDRR